MPHYLIRYTLNDGYAEFVGAASDTAWSVTPHLPTVADALAWADDQDAVPDPYAERITAVLEVGRDLGNGSPALWAYLDAGHDPGDLMWDPDKAMPGWVVVGADGLPIAPLPEFMERGAEVIDYVRRVQQAPWSVVGRWLSVRCDECGEVPARDDGHVLHPDGYVLVGCEGYWQVNPNVVGLDRPSWMDWTE